MRLDDSACDFIGERDKERQERIEQGDQDTYGADKPKATQVLRRTPETRRRLDVTKSLIKGEHEPLHLAREKEARDADKQEEADG